MTIRAATDDAHAGEINVFDVNPGLREAQIGFRLLPSFRGRGFASRATRLVTAWTFTTGKYRVYAGTAPDNVAAQRVLEAAGFEREGVQLERYPGRDGRRIDHVQFARRAPATTAAPAMRFRR